MATCTICKESLNVALLSWHPECLQLLAAKAGEYISAETERVSRQLEALTK